MTARRATCRRPSTQRRSELPLDLPNPPTYRKVNPADAPVMILAMTSDTEPPSQVFEYADSIIGQKLSQVEGVSQVFIPSAEKSAVRVQINPAALASTGLSLEDVRTFLTQVAVDQPKGSLDGEKVSYTLTSNDQLTDAREFRPLILAQRHNVPIKLNSLGQGDPGRREHATGRLGGDADGADAASGVVDCLQTSRRQRD